MKARILFVCTGNYARSQMAEGLARALVSQQVEVASAGTVPHPAGPHPMAVRVMQERGIDIRGQRSKHLDSVPGEFDYVITLCDHAARNCPMLPARRSRVHWSVPDPIEAPGDEAGQHDFFARVRDDIERRLEQWLRAEELLQSSSNNAATQDGPLTEKVRAELAKYEHPLFHFDAQPAGESVEVEIRFRPAEPEVHNYRFLLRPRDIEHPQFPWSFQRQLYDCLHDYVIEMFIRNPQRQD